MMSNRRNFLKGLLGISVIPVSISEFIPPTVEKEAIKSITITSSGSGYSQEFYGARFDFEKALFREASGKLYLRDGSK